MARRRIQASAAADPIGRDHRHPGQRQFQRHGAGFGQRRMRDPERRPLVRLRRPRSAAAPASSSRRRGPPPRRCGMVGRTGSNADALRPQPAERRAEHRHDGAGSRCGGFPAAPAAPAAAASRRVCSLGSGPQRGDLLDQGMTDIAAGRPAQPAIGLRLERQQRQHMVDISGASRAPGPAATPRPKARHNRRSGSRDRGRGPGAPPDG